MTMSKVEAQANIILLVIYVLLVVLCVVFSVWPIAILFAWFAGERWTQLPLAIKALKR